MAHCHDSVYSTQQIHFKNLSCFLSKLWEIALLWYLKASCRFLHQSYNNHIITPTVKSFSSYMKWRDYTCSDVSNILFRSMSISHFNMKYWIKYDDKFIFVFTVLFTTGLPIWNLLESIRHSYPLLTEQPSWYWARILRICQHSRYKWAAASLGKIIELFNNYDLHGFSHENTFYFQNFN